MWRQWLELIPWAPVTLACVVVLVLLVACAICIVGMYGLCLLIPAESYTFIGFGWTREHAVLSMQTALYKEQYSAESPVFIVISF